MRSILLFLGAALIGGCASYDGRGLVPGQATEADVVALMGKPAQTLERPGGGKALYYLRQPLGRQAFRFITGPDGRLKEREQILTAENIKRIRPGATTKEQVRELLGPPYRVARAPFKPLDYWEYPWLLVEESRMLWVGIGDDGVVGDVIEMHDLESDEPTTPG
jgi:hypothetical protein